MPAPVFFLESERRLIGRIAAGDRDALGSVYRANWKVILSFVLRNSGTEDDAADLLQEAVVVLWERIRNGRFEQRARVGTFLYSTVRNLWLRKLARRRREPSGEPLDAMADEDQPSPLEALMESEAAGEIRHALEQLGDPCRRLLVLYYWEEMSMEKIAEAMGFANADTVKARKYQCKKSLERLLRSAMT